MVDYFAIYEEMARPLLTDLELMILLAVLGVGDEAYGVPITRHIEKIGGRAVSLATVYATLDRLEERGLVKSRVGEPTAERGGKAKRFFRVTAAGLQRVRATQQAFTALWTNLRVLKGGTT